MIKNVIKGVSVISGISILIMMLILVYHMDTQFGMELAVMFIILAGLMGVMMYLVGREDERDGKGSLGNVLLTRGLLRRRGAPAPRRRRK